MNFPHEEGAPCASANFSKGRGDLPMLEIQTPWSNAHIYLHGAHVTHFQRHGQAPLLFLSESSRFESGHPIRGGIPLIFPWFGPRDGAGLHGFVRTKTWSLKAISVGNTGAVTARLALPDVPEAQDLPAFATEYWVTVGETLSAELIVANQSNRNFDFEACLHTYLAVGDIAKTGITGLKGASYIDKVDQFTRKTAGDEVLRIESEVDRVYLNTTSSVEIQDDAQGRVIQVEKWNSASTVVWNPWIAKAASMADFGNDEYQRMVCVESGNVSDNRVNLPAGECFRMKIRLAARPKA